MRNSSICPSRNVSEPYCERPIQLLPVLPRLEGLRVVPVFCPTCTPSTYRVAVLPDRVTATCFHTPAGSTGVPLICCSAPEPPVVMAKRTFEPLLGTRNMLAVVPVPKSKTRRQAAVVSRRTQVAMVKLVRL